MADSDSSAVVLGALVIGAVFVMVFSILPIPDKSTADSLIIEKANSLKETQVFLSEYPNAKVVIDRTNNIADGPRVKYSFEKIYSDGEVNEVRMFVPINPITREPAGMIELGCAIHYLDGFGGISTGSIVTDDIAETLGKLDCAK